MRFVVTLERAGRTHLPAPFEVEGDDADAIAEAIHDHVRAQGWIMSSTFSVSVGLPGDAAAVRLHVGMLRDGGSGRIAPSVTAQYAVGEQVEYRAPHLDSEQDGEPGTVASLGPRYVFVRFGEQVKACDPAHLWRDADGPRGTR